MSTFARTVLDIAAEVEAAEARLKRAVLAAARAGDCGAVVAIVTRWMAEPVTEVAASLPAPREGPAPAGRGGRRKAPELSSKGLD